MVIEAVDADSQLAGSSTTDNKGEYAIIGLGPGAYTVREIQQSGWSQTFPAAPGTHSVVLALGQTISGIDFGNQETGGLSNPKDEATGTALDGEETPERFAARNRHALASFAGGAVSDWVYQRTGPER